MPKPMEERFWEKVAKAGLDDCWEWQGWKSREGYGRIYRDGRGIQSHRAAYELLVGPIPEGLILDHLCRNRGCVNPAHLEPVTNRENVLRGNGPTAVNAAKTHCSKGHEYTLETISQWALKNTGRRQCRLCKRERDARRWAERRNAPISEPPE